MSKMVSYSLAYHLTWNATTAPHGCKPTYVGCEHPVGVRHLDGALRRRLPPHVHCNFDLNHCSQISSGPATMRTRTRVQACVCAVMVSTPGRHLCLSTTGWQSFRAGNKPASSAKWLSEGAASCGNVFLKKFCCNCERAVAKLGTPFFACV